MSADFKKIIEQLKSNQVQQLNSQDFPERELTLEEVKEFSNAFAENDSLVSLEFNFENHLNAEGAKLLAEAIKSRSLKTNRKLDNLGFASGGRFGAKGAEILLRTVLETGTVKRLELRECYYTNKRFILGGKDDNYAEFSKELIAFGSKLESGIAEVLESTKDSKATLELDLSGNWFRNVAEIAEALKGRPTITGLNLHDTTCTHFGLLIETLFFYNTKLTKLDLSSNNFKEDFVDQLEYFLSKNTAIKDLNLANTLSSIKSDYTRNKLISASLQPNSGIERLNLSNNSLGWDGIRVLRNALQSRVSNTNLKVLDLHGCDLGDSGIETLAPILAENKSILELNLRYNKLHDQGVKTLVEVLKTNDTLRSLDLSENYINTEGAQALADALRQKRNKTLSHLNLERPDYSACEPIDEKTLKEIKYYLEMAPIFQQVKVGTEPTIETPEIHELITQFAMESKKEAVQTPEEPKEESSELLFSDFGLDKKETQEKKKEKDVSALDESSGKPKTDEPSTKPKS